jgi:hypothetical protein
VPAEPGPAGRGDVPEVDLLEQKLVPGVGRVQRAQGLLVGAPRGRLIPEGVVRAAERERREGERRVGVQGAAEGGDRARRLARLQHDQPVDEVRVGVERVERQQGLHLGDRGVTMALARGGQRRREPPVPGLTQRGPRAWHRIAPVRLRGPRPLRRALEGRDLERAPKRVRHAEQQLAVGPQRGVQPFDHALGDRRLEVDQDVPAGDDVEAHLAGRGHRVADEVMPTEADQVAEALAHQVAAVTLVVQIPSAQRGLQGADGALAVPPFGGGGDGAARDVRAQHVNGRRRRGEGLGGQQGQRIGLLPGRAAGAPHADDGRARRTGAAQQAVPRDGIELVAVADEGGLMDRDLVDEPLHQAPSGHRIGRGADEVTRLELRRGAAQRGPHHRLVGDRVRDPRFPADELRYCGDRHG